MSREVNLYEKASNLEELSAQLQVLRADFDAHNHDGSSSRSFQTLLAETMNSRVLAIRKTSYADTTAGIWAGLVGNVMKFNLGSSTNFLKWDGTTVSIAGAITGGSLNINNNAIIDSSGNATFIGITSLNKKTFTNFEYSGRFVVTGDVAPTFGNQGMVIAPGSTANHYARCLWYISNYVFGNNPTFTATINALELNASSNDGAAFIGLGTPSVSGSGYTFVANHIGFYIRKASGTVTVKSSVSNGTATGNDLFTIVDGDFIELFIKVTSTSVKFYYRKNNGSMTLADTITANIPTAAENYISFSSTNMNSATDFKIQVLCSAYEN